MTKSKTDYSVGQMVLILGIVIASTPLSFFWTAYVLREMWLWFMVPLGLPVISLGHALGIDVLLWFVAGQRGDPNAPKKKELTLMERLGEATGKAFLLPGFVLFLGWICRMWMG